MSEPKVHWWRTGVALCGAPVTDGRWTDKRDEVTCRMCLGTLVHEEAERRALAAQVPCHQFCGHGEPVDGCKNQCSYLGNHWDHSCTEHRVVAPTRLPTLPADEEPAHDSWTDGTPSYTPEDASTCLGVYASQLPALTRRDVFALVALHALITGRSEPISYSVKEAVRIADSLMKDLDK